MTVSQLRAVLEKLPPDAQVLVWFPGTYITLGSVLNTKDGRPLIRDGSVLIEGDIYAGDLDYGNLPELPEAG